MYFHLNGHLLPKKKYYMPAMMSVIFPLHTALLIVSAVPQERTRAIFMSFCGY